MTEKLRPIFYAFAIFSVLWVWGNCRESAGASKQRLRDSTVVVNAHSHQTDLRVSRLAAESLELGARLMRSEAVTRDARGEIARLLHKTTPLLILRNTPDSSNTRDTLLSQLAIRDTIIAQQDTVIAQQDSQLTIWKALAVERGELLQRALQERDAFRKIATAWEGKAGKRLGCAGGPTVVATLSGHVSVGFGASCGVRF